MSQLSAPLQRPARAKIGWLLALSIAPFLAFPNLDIYISRLFYNPEAGFYLAGDALVQGVYWLFAKIHFVIFPVLLFLFLWNQYVFRKHKGRARVYGFLLLALVLGPGLMVNAGLKEHWGRARPAQVHEFGGPKQYSPPQIRSGECSSNCSFVSGHASMGFFAIALAWVFRKRWVFLAGTALGLAVGLGRVVQGAHFLSDVVFAFWAVFAACAVAAWLIDELKVKRQPLGNSEPAVLAQNL